MLKANDSDRWHWLITKHATSRMDVFTTHLWDRSVGRSLPGRAGVQRLARLLARPMHAFGFERAGVHAISRGDTPCPLVGYSAGEEVHLADNILREGEEHSTALC
jgi:hypothetical protein